MDFLEALALVEKASTDASRLSFHEGMQINAACAVVAMEYVRIKHRIGPDHFPATGGA